VGGTLARAYVYVDGLPVAELASDGQFYWVHKDPLGTGRKLIDTRGAVVYRGEFDPHGQSLLETGSALLNSHKYTGYERDQATGLDYAEARMYQSNTGRFTSPDPLGLGAADLKRPQSLNRYSYVENDPVNFYDPDGLTRCGDLPVITGGTVRDYVNEDSDYGKLLRLVWHEAGHLVDDNGGDVNTMYAVQLRIAQAILNRFDIVNGRVAVLGKDGNAYWGEGDIPGFLRASILGYGRFGRTLTAIIRGATAGTTVVDDNGEITNKSALDRVLNTELGDPTRQLPGRYFVAGTNYYVTPECFGVIAAMQSTNTIGSGIISLNNPGFFVTSWKRINNSNPDPTRLYDFDTLGKTLFWGFQVYRYALYPGPSEDRSRPSGPGTSPRPRTTGGRRVI
jgi:RHS repeat-associated protein